MKILQTETIAHYKQELNIFETSSPVPEMMLRNELYPSLPVCHEELIWGYEIVKKAQNLGIKELHCHSFPEMNRKEKLKLALTIENRAGKYSWNEKKNILEYISPNEPDRETLMLIEGKDDPHFLMRYHSYSALSSSLKEMVNTQILNIKTAEEIRELPEELFSHFLKNINSLHLSFSTRRIFLTLIHEISRRDRLSKTEIMNLYETFIKSSNPLKECKEARYPQLTVLNNKMDTFKKEHLKGTGINIKEPENFEGNSFTLTFSFTEKNIEKKLKALNIIKDKKDELFGLL